MSAQTINDVIEHFLQEAIPIGRVNMHFNSGQSEAHYKKRDVLHKKKKTPWEKVCNSQESYSKFDDKVRYTLLAILPNKKFSQ